MNAIPVTLEGWDPLHVLFFFLISLGVFIFGWVLAAIGNSTEKLIKNDDPTTPKYRAQKILSGLFMLVGVACIFLGAISGTFGTLGYGITASDSWDKSVRIDALHAAGHTHVKLSNAQTVDGFSASDPDGNFTEGVFAKVGEPDQWLIITGLEDY